MIHDEYTSDWLNDKYFEKPIRMSDNIKFGTINRTSYITRRITIYDYEYGK